MIKKTNFNNLHNNKIFSLNSKMLKSISIYHPHLKILILKKKLPRTYLMQILIDKKFLLMKSLMKIIFNNNNNNKINMIMRN